MNQNDTLGQPISYWIDSTKTTDYPKLNQDLKIDIAIVGGGITGITSALLLKKEGYKVAVIDADRIAEGTTGHTTAKITCQHDLIYDRIIKSMGKDRAQQYADANKTAMVFIENLIKEYSIECDFEKQPAYAYTQQDKYINQIKNEVDAALSLGINAKYLDNLPLPFSIKAAVCFDDQAQFHPRKYILALASKIPGDGSHIFENTKIINLIEDNPCILLTDDNRKISASKVIIASHFPFHDGLGFYFARLFPSVSYVLGVKLKEKFPDGMYINVESPGRSLRKQRYKDCEMVLVGGEGHKTGHGEDTMKHYNNLKVFTQSAFKVDSYLYRWLTEDYITPDGVPFAGYLTSSAENIYVATGYGKWGMTNSTAASILLRDLIVKGDSSWQEVYNPSRYTSSSGKKILQENIDVAKQLIKGKLAPGDDSLNNIKNGEATVISSEDNKYGVFKDDNNTLHIVDITCTHFGCELKWNSAEKTWDCPCHGSRFSYDGDIVEGPAFRPLQSFTGDPNNIDPDIF